MSEREYKQLFKSENYDSKGFFGIQILVAGDELPPLSTESISYTVHYAAKSIEAEIKAMKLAIDPQAQEHAVRERKELLDSFEGRIFAEEIPNGYCQDYCCRHLPWFVVTTEIGRFKLGRRKRVIHLEWTETLCTCIAEELFPNDDVTKYDKTIHAYSLDNLRRYIKTVTDCVPKRID